jgi:hypothetical protein
MHILQLLWSLCCPLANTPQLNCQLNYSAISSLPPLHNSTGSLSKSKSKSHCDWRAVSQQILVSSPIWGSWPDINYYRLTVTVLFLWGALFDTCQRNLSRVRVPWLATIFYCPRFETYLFVASYDSQGHGGGIPPGLHTGLLLCPSPSHIATDGQSVCLSWCRARLALIYYCWTLRFCFLWGALSDGRMGLSFLHATQLVWGPCYIALRWTQQKTLPPTVPLLLLWAVAWWELRISFLWELCQATHLPSRNLCLAMVLHVTILNSVWRFICVLSSGIFFLQGGGSVEEFKSDFRVTMDVLKLVH